METGMTWCTTGMTSVPPSCTTLAPPMPVRTNAMFAEALRYKRVITVAIDTSSNSTTPMVTSIHFAAGVRPGTTSKSGTTASVAPIRNRMNIAIIVSPFDPVSGSTSRNHATHIARHLWRVGIGHVQRNHVHELQHQSVAREILRRNRSQGRRERLSPVPQFGRVLRRDDGAQRRRQLLAHHVTYRTCSRPGPAQRPRRQEDGFRFEPDLHEKLRR